MTGKECASSITYYVTAFHCFRFETILKRKPARITWEEMRIWNLVEMCFIYPVTFTRPPSSNDSIMIYHASHRHDFVSVGHLISLQNIPSKNQRIAMMRATASSVISRRSVELAIPVFQQSSEFFSGLQCTAFLIQYQKKNQTRQFPFQPFHKFTMQWLSTIQPPSCVGYNPQNQSIIKSHRTSSTFHWSHCNPSHPYFP